MYSSGPVDNSECFESLRTSLNSPVASPLDETTICGHIHKYDRNSYESRIYQIRTSELLEPYEPPTKGCTCSALARDSYELVL